MITGITLRYEGYVPGMRGGKRVFNRCLKEAYQEMGIHWHTDIRPRHFETAASSRYDYKPRRGEPGNPDPRGWSQSYTGKKAARYGHRNPLMKSGSSREISRLGTVTASARHCRITFSAGRLGMPGRGNAPDMIDEVTRVDTEDAKELAEVFAEALEDALAKVKNKQTVRI
jgi:hypothetical protein